MSAQGLAIVPATPERWPDLADLFRASGDSGHCWCAWFRMPNRAFGAARVAERRARLEGLVATDARPGLLAYALDQAIGWVSVVPRRTLERIEAPDRPPPADAGPVWAVTCFVIRPGHRRQGVAGALLDAAVEHAREQGAAIVEGYPVESARSASSAFPGVVSMYLRSGFRESGRFDRWAAAPAASGPTPVRVARPPGRPVMRLDLR
jgi:GNAT superfamily N-acetyltransferase